MSTMEVFNATLAEPTGSLTCTLLDRRSSVPLAGARITCVWRDNRMTRFDADRHGNFVTDLPQGVYDLVISARGYLSLLVRGVGVLGGTKQIIRRALIPGDGTAPEGEPATALGGFVRDRLGRPISNLTLSLRAENGGAAYTTRSDRDGAFILHGVIPEMYDLTVRSLDRTVARDHVAIAHVKTFVRLDLRVLQA